MNQPYVVDLIDGPYDKKRISGNFSNSIGLPVDRNLRACNASKPYALANYTANTNLVYSFVGFYKQEGHISIKILGGPSGGSFQGKKHPIIRRVPLDSLGKPIGPGSETVASVAIYELGNIEEVWGYYYVETNSEKTVVAEEQRKIDISRARQAAQAFYDRPDYSIYSQHPTEEHRQVPISLGRRRAQVDERIAGLIIGLWKHGFDTIGSCQERSSNKAYVAFNVPGDGEAFFEILNSHGIQAKFIENKQRLSNNMGQTIELLTSDVTFSPDDIDRITEILASKS